MIKNKLRFDSREATPDYRMTGTFSVKLKSKKGQFVVKDLSVGTTIADLKKRISQVTQIREAHLHVLIGFPPRPIDLSEDWKNLGASGITSGETLIVEEKPNPGAITTTAATATTSQSMQPSIEDDEALARRLQAEEDEEEQLRQVVAEAEAAAAGNVTHTGGPIHQQVELPSGSSGDFNGILLKKVVPADNSCLFTSIRFVLNGKVDNEGSEMMRHIIAQEVAADPQEYNDAVLGKSNSEYCAWIQRPESWGGAIEVSILSNYYGIEIDVVDIQNAIINRFGEDKNYGLRVFLLFDGIHYDPLYMETVGVSWLFFQIPFAFVIIKEFLLSGYYTCHNLPYRRTRRLSSGGTACQ